MVCRRVIRLTAVVTAVLNLDTAVVFLTPVLIETARARGLNERPFVYGTVFMSNSASLLLVGSNLTNLLVVDGARLSGIDFARTMLAPWTVAVMVTLLVFSIIQRRQPQHATWTAIRLVVKNNSSFGPGGEGSFHSLAVLFHYRRLSAQPFLWREN